MMLTSGCATSQFLHTTPLCRASSAVLCYTGQQIILLLLTYLLILDGSLPKWCPAVALSRQDGRHSAVALLLKAALIQVSDYRLLGASGYIY
jgi:hypothetical protein